MKLLQTIDSGHSDGAGAKASDLQCTISQREPLAAIPQSHRVAKVRRIFARLEADRVVLDVGCGTGGILQPFVGAHQIHGVDISAKMVKLAQAAGIRARVHDIESDRLPYADKTFDVVFCGETIEHTVNTDWVVAEINRVLKPGGRLILTFPNVRTLPSLVMMTFFDLPPMYSARYRAPHFRDFTLRTMKIVMREHGLRVENAIGTAFYLPKLGEVAPALASFLPSWATPIIIVAAKEKDSSYEVERAIDARIY